MADGDYERGRSREIAELAARLKRLSSARPTILTLNGWAASHHAWDLCSFVKNPKCSILSYTDQLERFPLGKLPAQPIDNKTILVGWSMGANVALRLAAMYPDKIAGLVLVAATPRLMQAEGGWIGMSERRLEALRKGLELTHGQGFFGIPEGKPNPYMVDKPENLEAGLRYLLDVDVREDLQKVFAGRNVKFPVYLFQSERDGIVRKENISFLTKIFPQANVTMVPGSEHALSIMIPDEIDAAVHSCISHAAKKA